MPCAQTAASQVPWTEGLQRPLYYPRQIVTPAELNLESRYFVERLRRHNRMLHGWGVVCGAQVCRVPNADGTGAEPWKLKLRPGYLIDGYGNDVVIDVDRVVDFRSSVVQVAPGDAAGELRDPWCSDVWTAREGGTIWVAVCHEERPARRVRAQPSACSCDDVPCEYSRLQDAYRVTFLDECPASHAGQPPKPEELLARLSGGLRECPACPEDPCVVLAAVAYEADGTITAIDNCSCRRNVVSLADLWWRCAGGVVKATKATGTPAGPYEPDTPGVKLAVVGQGIAADAAVDLGAGVEIVSKNVTKAGRALDLELTIAKDAAPGARTLTIENPDCSTARLPKALTIAEPASPGAKAAGH
jgi:hypothetical protein